MNKASAQRRKHSDNMTKRKKIATRLDGIFPAETHYNSNGMRKDEEKASARDEKVAFEMVNGLFGERNATLELMKYSVNGNHLNTHIVNMCCCNAINRVLITALFSALACLPFYSIWRFSGGWRFS